MNIVGWLNSEWLRNVAYAVAAVACTMAGRRERAEAAAGRTGLWPKFWFVAAGFLVLLLFARVSGLGWSAYDFGKREAILGGWYWSRRKLQAAVIIGMGSATLIAAFVFARLMGDTLRRYMLPLLCLLGLIGFSATRVVSLHQIDTVLYRRPILGARLASVIELSLIGSLGGLAVFFESVSSMARRSRAAWRAAA